VEINYLWASLQFIGDAAATAKAAAAIYFQIFAAIFIVISLGIATRLLFRDHHTRSSSTLFL
jgi:hypothetical protein